jgi:hypothetical protein
MKDNFDWDNWLKEKEKFLEESGYIRYNEHLKGEDFVYWKNFIDENEEKIYQIGVLFFDFRDKYNLNRIDIEYECRLICDDCISLSVHKDIFITSFEIMSSDFYKVMKIYK